MFICFISFNLGTVKYDECITDENGQLGNGMFDKALGTFTSLAKQPALFSFTATSLLKSENNSPVYLQIMKHNPELDTKVDCRIRN